MKDGGTAFPVVSVFVDASNTDEPSGTTISSERGGMSMRQYYKAAAIQGILSSENESSAYGPFRLENASLAARRAGEIADAMLDEDEEHDSR